MQHLVHAVLVLALVSGSVVAADVQHFESDFAEWSAVLKDDPLLSLGGVDGRTVQEKQWLVGIGLAKIASADAKGMRDARTVATAKAKAQIAQFLKSDVATETALTTEKVSEDSAEGRKIRARKMLRETTTINASEALRQVKVVGSWTAGDDGLYGVAVVVPVGNSPTP